MKERFDCPHMRIGVCFHPSHKCLCEWSRLTRALVAVFEQIDHYKRGKGSIIESRDDEGG